jgi:hypothetical protein
MANELIVSVEEATKDNIEVGDTVVGIFSDGEDPRDEYYFGRVFDIADDENIILVAWEYDEEDPDYVIDLDEVPIDNVYKLLEIEENIPKRKMPPKTLDILSQFKQ